MADSIRAFIAIELNNELRQVLRQVQDHLKSVDCDVKWVKPENAHLTLKFLGDVKPPKIETIINALEKAFKDADPIQTELTQPGAFPGWDHPRVLWIGLKDDQNKISRLAESLESALGEIGFRKEDRPFRPHITIARMKSSRNAGDIRRRLAAFSLAAGISQTIDHVVLFKSTLTSQGPVYESLKKILIPPSPPTAPPPA